MIIHSAITLSLLSLLILADSCQPRSRTTTPVDPAEQIYPPDMHTSRDALDWAGTYMGKLPCADCASIETVITLSASGRYRKSTLYSGRTDEVFVEEGVFEWHSDGGRITLLSDEGDIGQQYRVGEDRLFHLDEEGRRIEGALADRYILRRINTPLEGIQWLLIRIGEQSVALEAEDKDPYILLAGDRLQAWAGCNRMSAVYHHHPGQLLRIESVMRTKMACEDMTLEEALAQILEKTQRYLISDRTLFLYAAPSELLATFRAE
jgi:copper homeostasis protein (lipoprotein)